MTRNVLVGWTAHSILIVTGFIIPRIIDRQIGTVSLGVWDFTWALVTYFALVRMGVVSSVNRYVAKFRAAGDQEGVSRAITSVTCVLGVMSAIILILSIGAAMLLPWCFAEKLGENLRETQWVVFLLGLSLAVQAACSGFGGVLTGCHRYDLHDAIETASNLFSVAAMIGVLMIGGGLRWLAVIVLSAEIMGWGARIVMAYRICPELRVRFRYAEWPMARRMLVFGAKSFVPHMGELLLYQTCSILIMIHLGPGPLAIFSRPRSLVRHVRMLVMRYARILTPTASSLQEMHMKHQLQDLLIRSVRTGLYIALPAILMLVVLGNSLITLWMGKSYDVGVLGILAVGFLPFIAMLPTWTILKGINAHGRFGFAYLISAAITVVLTALFLGPLKLGLIAVAWAMAAPVGLINALFVPFYASRQLGIPLGKFLRQSARGPVLCSVPYLCCLLAGRWAFPDAQVAALTLGLSAGGAVLLPLYWRYALPVTLKSRLLRPFQTLVAFRRTPA